VELLAGWHPGFRNAHVGTFIASILGIVLVLTDGGSTSGYSSEGPTSSWRRSALMHHHGVAHVGRKIGISWALWPMIFMFITTIAALLYTSYSLLNKVLIGQ
jgi:hypothetical protein